jgi:hypothetical protein
MSCPNQVGVKNLTLGFTDCDGDSGGIGNVAPLAHVMSLDELPMYQVVPYKLEGLSGGRVKRTYENSKIELSVVRNLAVPLAYYQGRASIDYQCEHINGSVMTGVGGFVTGQDTSDGNDVKLTIEFATIVEVLPPGATLQ